MSTPTPPIPGPIWEGILAFLRSAKTGQITLFVHDGRVCDCAFLERIRAARRPRRGPPKRPNAQEDLFAADNERGSMLESS